VTPRNANRNSFAPSSSCLVTPMTNNPIDQQYISSNMVIRVNGNSSTSVVPASLRDHFTVPFTPLNTNSMYKKETNTASLVDMSSINSEWKPQPKPNKINICDNKGRNLSMISLTNRK
jgi:hypothetical protein